jgi:hypothetical protein
LTAINSEDSDLQMGSKPRSIVNLSSSSALNTTAASGSNLKNEKSSPTSSKTAKLQDWMSDHTLRERLPFMDELSDPTSETSQIDCNLISKPFNGLPTVVCETSSGEAVHGIQPLGRNLTGGWL